MKINVCIIISLNCLQLVINFTFIVIWERKVFVVENIIDINTLNRWIIYNYIYCFVVLYYIVVILN